MSGACSSITRRTAARTSAWLRALSASVASQASPVRVWTGPSPKRRPLPPATASKPSIRPKVAPTGVDRGVGLRLVAQVGGGVGGLGPGRPESVDELGAMGLGLRGHEDAGALGGEEHRGGGGDAGRTRDQAGLAGQAIHRSGHRLEPGSALRRWSRSRARSPRRSAVASSTMASSRSRVRRRMSSAGALAGTSSSRHSSRRQDDRLQRLGGRGDMATVVLAQDVIERARRQVLVLEARKARRRADGHCR